MENQNDKNVRQEEVAAVLQTEPAEKSIMPQRYLLKFTGSAGEYFRIWIVNTFLTVITLGIYAAWAKVRTRRYFYANTKLDDYPFEYTANPVAILIGNLILAGGIVLIAVANYILPVLSDLFGIAFAIILPFLIYKSLRFRARNSAYRNIRFHFVGTLGQSYRIYFWIPILIPFTIGLLYPYWALRRKEYFFDNFSYGSAKNNFYGESGPFYRIYLLCALMFIMGIVLQIFIIFGLAEIFFQVGGEASDGGKVGLVAFLPLIFFMVFYTFIDQFIFARLNNYCWGRSQLREVRFESTLKVRNLIWIRLSNIAAILFSIGLLIPWAKVRRAQYILDNLRVITDSTLEEFTAVVEPEESALGEAATDFFDVEIGL
ncbi:MAG: YjgN family protein [Planctomycetota bacterium]|jgi:uncharacterized membrane protein YjgN (DUF898 family)